jgi:methionyl-tRNA formyltransferase
VKMRVLFCGRKRVSADLLTRFAADPRFEIVGVLTDSHLPVSPTTEAAALAGIPVLDYKQVIADAASGVLTIDLVISVLYWRKLPMGLIAAAPLGAINFHPAPLPQYKGCAGYNLAILESRDDWGITAHYMDAEIDTGGIIEVAWFPIDRERETTLTLEATSVGVLHDLVVRTINRVADAKAILPSEPNVGGQYVSRAMMEAMKEVVDGDDVSRKARAFWFPPYDGAYVTVNGEKFTLVNRAILQSLADPANSSLFLDAHYKREIL